MMRELMAHQAQAIERVMASHGLRLRVVGGTAGPRLVIYRALKPTGVKLASILRMDEEIALALGVPACRITRSGHHLTIEIPRRDSEAVLLLQVIDRAPRRLGAVVLGVDEEDTPLFLSLDSPNVGHVLICGTTGSGKTALARTMITGLAASHATFELSLVLIDPKRRGYLPFAGLPHLVHPVIHDPEAALGALAWAVEELERRDRAGVCSPRMLVFIDELADLMQAAGDEAGESLTRLVQRGREAGVHVVACTQKPTAAVIGSLVKANFPTRILGRVTDTNDAYVASGISGTGAERLLGRGDFLVVAGGEVTRMQAAYISEAEIEELVTRLRGGRSFQLQREGDSAEPGRIIDFMERFRARREAGQDQDRGIDEAQIRRDLASGLSLNRIQDRHFGYRGGKAYRVVAAIRDEMGDTTTGGGVRSRPNG